MSLSIHRTLGLACAFLLLAAAQVAPAAQRTFVASTGNDANACSLATPCRGFARAMTQTDSKGEIIVLDSAGYGAVTVDKSVSIIAPPGVYAGITVFSGDGIVVNGSGISVVLRGLTINGQGGSRGIWYTFGAKLLIDRCTVANFSGAGIDIGYAGEIVIADSNIRGNLEGIKVRVNPQVLVMRTHVEGNAAAGIDFAPALGASSLAVIDSHVIRNATGISTIPTGFPTTVTIARSWIAENSQAAIAVSTFDAAASVDFDMRETTIAGNHNGVSLFVNAGLGAISASLTDNRISGNLNNGLQVVNAGTVAVIDRNTISHNATGIFRSGGIVRTRSTNTVRGNSSDVIGGPLTGVGGT